MQKLALKNKKKEHIIWDEAKEEYIAKLIPYASRVSGPLIEVPNVDAFKGIEGFETIECRTS